MNAEAPSTERYLDGRHAVVTGGSRGIGAAIAEALARRGAKVTLMSRSKEALEQQADALRRAHRVEAGAIICDVTSDASVTEAFARALRERGEVYVLVNNAGAAESAPFAQTSRALWDRMIATNLTSTYACTSQVLPSMMRGKGGRVVNVASTAGLRGYKTMTAYCAAKHGVVGLTKALAQEAARHGVTVNAVCPGYTETDLTDAAISNIVSALGKTPEEARGMLERTVTRGTLITPDEVAAAVAWLCAPEASGVNGVALPIAGGAVP
jgi:NAD(P)-dependent dehydrogenase (short-subunit alcohol dehydrogenase family)